MGGHMCREPTIVAAPGADDAAASKAAADGKAA